MRCIASASARSFNHTFRINFTRCARSAHSAAVAIAQGAPSRTHFELTDAQASRAASTVVRHFCSTGELRNAYFIVNSLRSTSPSTSTTTLSRSIPSDTLHNLLNDKDTLDLGNRKISPRLACHSLLHGLVRLGLTKKAGLLAQMMMEDGIRIRSRTFQTVIQSLAHAPAPSTLVHVKSHFNAKPQNVLRIHPSQVADPYLRFATRLLLDARRYRQTRTKDMFNALIRACILQGEIIVGSLLLVLAVKDWKTRAIQNESTGEEGLQELEQTDAPLPPQAAMNQLLRFIEDSLQNGSDETHGACVQSLANIAVLLEEQSLPFSRLAPLLGILGRYPRTNHDVWISVPGPELCSRVNAYDYFNRVLLHTATHLPSKKKKKRLKDGRHPSHLLPPLDLESYNTLLHYALHHRMDAPLSRGIMRHLNTQGRLQPDAVTKAIVLRAETLHQRPLHLICSPVDESSSVDDNPQALATYVTLMTEAGRPDAISTILSHMLPELSIIPYPSSPPSSSPHRLEREEGLCRAVALGPYFFSSLLNALAKAGRMGLAEQVWFLAKEAERASWSSDREGWCLPLPAYMSMLQCYATRIRRSRNAHTTLDEAVREVGNQRYIRGWARYLVVRRKILAKQRDRRTTAQLMAMELDRSLKEGARDVFYSLMEMQSSVFDAVPKPDSRFFNVLLSIFTKSSLSCKRHPPTHYRRHLHTAEIYYTRFRIKSAYWHPFLKELAEAMYENGHDVPLGLRYLFVGRFSPATKGKRDCQRRFRPFRLEVGTKGLRTKRRMRSRRKPRRLFA